MTKKEMTGQTCVGKVRLAPVDLGFDLRLHDMIAEVPADLCSVGYEQGGRVWLAEGEPEELIAELEAAGYRVRVVT